MMKVDAVMYPFPYICFSMGEQNWAMGQKYAINKKSTIYNLLPNASQQNYVNNIFS